MIGFVYKTYNEKLGPFYNGDQKTLSNVMKKQEAVEWFSKYEKYMIDVEVQVPWSWRHVVKIPVTQNTKYNGSLEEHFRSVTNVDTQIRMIILALLDDYWFNGESFYKMSGSLTGEKMESKSMETLQLMKDHFMWLVRYDPIVYYTKESVGGKREPKELELVSNYTVDGITDVHGEMLYEMPWSGGLTYNVWGKTYQTEVYGSYTRNVVRWALWKFAWMTDFHWWHELQYWQRMYNLCYTQLNYLVASRESGKSLLIQLLNMFPMFKSPTSFNDFSNKIGVYYVAQNQDMFDELNGKLLWFFEDLLSPLFTGNSKNAYKKFARWVKSEDSFVLSVDNEDRRFKFVSDRGTSPRWLRAAGSVIDEAAYLLNYEEFQKTLIGSSDAPVHSISTVSKNSHLNYFFKRYNNALAMTKSLPPIDEVIHTIWTRHGFDKITRLEDCKEMAKAWVYDRARTDFYEMRPIYAMECDIDKVEWMDEKSKKLKVQKLIDSSSVEDAWAEFYCKLMPKKSIFSYKKTISPIADIPKYFDKIFVGYDEAAPETDEEKENNKSRGVRRDNPTFCAGWVVDGKLYVLECWVLPSTLNERYNKLNQICKKWEGHSIDGVALIFDANRWSYEWLELARRVPYSTMWFKKNARGNAWKIVSEGWLKIASVGKNYLVYDLLNTELFPTWKIIMSDELDELFAEMDNFVRKDNGVIEAAQWSDDLVDAFMMMAFLAYIEFVKDGKKARKKSQFESPIHKILHDRDQKELADRESAAAKKRLKHLRWW